MQRKNHKDIHMHLLSLGQGDEDEDYNQYIDSANDFSPDFRSTL